MVPRSGASDFVAGQSHQNRFRNLRFLKTSLTLYWQLLGEPQRVFVDHLQFRIRALRAGFLIFDDACVLRTAPAADKPRWCDRPRSAIGTKIAVGAFGKTKRPPSGKIQRVTRGGKRKGKSDKMRRGLYEQSQYSKGKFLETVGF